MSLGLTGVALASVASVALVASGCSNAATSRPTSGPTTARSHESATTPADCTLEGPRSTSGTTIPLRYPLNRAQAVALARRDLSAGPLSAQADPATATEATYLAGRADAAIVALDGGEVPASSCTWVVHLLGPGSASRGILFGAGSRMSILLNAETGGDEGTFGNPQPAAMSSPADPAPPCPPNQATPSFATGSFCGPAPVRGNGHGPDGECTGTGPDTAPPCGPGAVPGRYYDVTLPGDCTGKVIFDGRVWLSELPPPFPVAPFNVWMALQSGGASAGFISPSGSVGFQPYHGQPVGTCTAPPTNAP